MDRTALYFDTVFDQLPPGQDLTLTRERWQWIKARCEADTSKNAAIEEPTGRASRQSYRPRHLTGTLECAESTVRERIRDGWFGPAAPLLRGKGYDIPAALVERFKEERERLAKEMKEQQVGPFCLTPLFSGPEAELTPGTPSATTLMPSDTTEVAEPAIARREETGPREDAGGPTARIAQKRTKSDPICGKTDLGSWRKRDRSAKRRSAR